MKKREIINLIEANRKIIENKDLVNMTKETTQLGFTYNRKIWLPNVEELKEEFEILKSEILDAINITEENEKIIKESKCSHEIRLEYWDCFTSSYKCIFCGNYVSSDNDVTFGHSINRNRRTVTFVAKDQDKDIIEEGFTEEDVYKLIIEILKDKDDDEEIDLVNEFKKLNLPKCEIDERKKVNENFILIIGGTNKENLENGTYITTNVSHINSEFIKYFRGLLYTKIETIENEEYLNSSEFKKSFSNTDFDLKLTQYNTIEELIKALNYEKEIPFKIIIDMTNLYSYKIKDNKLIKEKQVLNLSEIFPNSYIIKIEDLSKKELEEIKTILMNMKQENESYGYDGETYYYLEEGELEETDLNGTLKRIKKLLRS